MFDSRKVFIVLAVLGVSYLGVYLGAGDALRLSEKAPDYIGVTFSILAASLFATVSIVGDPSMLLPGNWRSAWDEAKRIQLRLMRLVYLFVLYLIVLALLVVTEIIEAEKITSAYFVHDFFAFSVVLAFICSFWLPFEIKKIQITRLEQEIKRRKEKSGS